MFKKKSNNKELSLHEAKKIVARIGYKRQSEEDELREAALILLKEVQPDFEYEPEESAPAEGNVPAGADQVASAAATVAASGAAAAATTATTAATSTIGTAIAQLQSLGTAGVIAMSSAVYFQGGAVYDNAETIIDEVTPVIEEIVITGMYQPPEDSVYAVKDLPKIDNFLGVKVGEAREVEPDNDDEPKEKEGADDTTSEGKTSATDSETSEDKNKSDEKQAKTVADKSDEKAEEKPKKKSLLGSLFGDKKDDKKEEKKKDEPVAEQKTEETKPTKAEEPAKPQPKPKGLFSIIGSALSNDKPEQKEPEPTAPEPVSEEIVEAASASVSDAELKEVGISRQEFENWVGDGAPSDTTPYMDEPPEVEIEEPVEHSFEQIENTFLDIFDQTARDSERMATPI